MLISWLDSGHALLLILLAAAGLLFLRNGTEWRPGVRAEFYLCAALALAIGAEVSATHPTFSRYYLLAVPFVSILAAAGDLRRLACAWAAPSARSGRPSHSAC